MGGGGSTGGRPKWVHPLVVEEIHKGAPFPTVQELYAYDTA